MNSCIYSFACHCCLINSIYVTYRSCIGHLAKFIGTHWEYGRGLLLPQRVAVWAAQFVFHRAGQQPRCCISCLASPCDLEQPEVRMWGCEHVGMWGCFPPWAVPLVGQPEPEPWCCSDPNAVPVLARAVEKPSPMFLWSAGMGLFRKGKGDLLSIFQVAESVPVFPSLPAKSSKKSVSPPTLPSHPFSEVNKCQQMLHLQHC